MQESKLMGTEETVECVFVIFEFLYDPVLVRNFETLLPQGTQLLSVCQT
jgi:hypothetical protein